ncbi:unnamed protein product [Leptosia nina]|uniref:Uncharacterized protein n=1 Tax=Leptosia nina TaxID=320188 RepID=A0AAV1J2W7_9NEOP
MGENLVVADQSAYALHMPLDTTNVRLPLSIVDCFLTPKIDNHRYLTFLMTSAIFKLLFSVFSSNVLESSG